MRIRALSLLHLRRPPCYPFHILLTTSPHASLAVILPLPVAFPLPPRLIHLHMPVWINVFAQLPHLLLEGSAGGALRCV